MKRIYIPTQGAEDWKRFLAQPEKQWRSGFSAKSLASCWESANGFPPEIAQMFTQSGIAAFQQVEPLLAFPEYTVSLPGGGTPSQNDLFVLAKDTRGGLLTIAVEGKVSEDFGPTLAEWGILASQGKQDRLAFIQSELGLTAGLPTSIRYQLLHRTISAVIEAKRFNARSAVMLVHSFSLAQKRFEDYANFLQLYGQAAVVNQLVFLKRLGDIDLYSAWVKGDPRFLAY